MQKSRGNAAKRPRVIEGAPAKKRGHLVEKQQAESRRQTAESGGRGYAAGTQGLKGLSTGL